MYIHEAVKIALETGKCITKPDMSKHLKIQPTNSPFYRMVLRPTKEKEIAPGPRWNTSADDLASDEWTLTD